jgi:carbamoyl-phosphate synthase large subunit
MVERCVSGWKEIEFEGNPRREGQSHNRLLDGKRRPVGVHTGDSVVIAPAVTLADKEYQMLRTASLRIIDALGVEGGCNCQFALNPNSFEYAVIEVNPRVSRSSALAFQGHRLPDSKGRDQDSHRLHPDEIGNRRDRAHLRCIRSRR